MTQPSSIDGQQNPARGPPRRAAPLRVREVRPAALSPDDIAAWLDLESRALEPNLYLSPHFVLPALRHLEPADGTVIAFVEEDPPRDRTVRAAAVLQPRRPILAMPMPHRCAYLSPHSYLSGVLVAADDPRRYLEALLRHRHGFFGHALVLESCAVDGPADRLLVDIAAASRMHRSESNAYLRAAMRPREMGEAYLAGPLSSRSKKLRSQKKKLGELGTVRFEVLRGRAVDGAAIERHLALEHMGWKGESGTSMRSHPGHEAFFREMSAALAAADRALFMQLSLGDQVIASASNFTAGTMGFAFKIGFDPRFSQFAPGIMCEMEFLRCAPEVAGHLESFDSGAVAGSYLEGMWPDRRRIATVAYSTSAPGRLVLACHSRLRRLKQAIGRRRAGTASPG
jgi:CelD/BcsL family acetyltransferase involved in cellulose biosynthesis